MAEPLGIIALAVQLTPQVIEYISSVKDASKEKEKLLIEVASTRDVLTAVLDIVQDQPSTNNRARTAINDKTIIATLQDILATLEQLSDKLVPKPGLNRIGSSLAWPFKKKDTQEMLGRLSRSKQTIIVHLQIQDVLTDQQVLESLDTLTFGQDLSHRHHQEILEKLDSVVPDPKLQEVQRAVDSFSVLDHRRKHHLVSTSRTEGTNDWLFETSVFQDWFAGDNHLLILHGGPGVGKTVMISAVVNFIEPKLDSFGNAASAFIYLDYKERSQQTYEAVFHSITKQILQSNPFRARLLKKLASTMKLSPNRFLASLDSQGLSRILDTNLDRLYLMIDALDESDSAETQTQIENLIDHLQSSSCRVKILVTTRSRSVHLINHASAAFYELKPSDDDIKTYIFSRTQSDDRLRHLLRQDPDLRSKIVDAVFGRAQGMFLLARLHMDTLADSRVLADLDDHLEALPQGMEALRRTYFEAVERLRSQDRRDAILAERILIWVCFSKRHLKVGELRQAVAIEVDKDEPDFNERRLLPQEDLTALCAGLVIVDPGNNEVRLVHHTTQEFFDQKRDIIFPDAKKVLVTTCIKFLSYNRFQWCTSSEAIQDIQNRNPLLRYVVDHLQHHFREAGDACKDEVIAFLADRPKRNFVLQIAEGVLMANPPRFLDLLSILTVAAKWRLNEVVRTLLKHGSSTRDRGELSRLPLHQAGYNKDNTELLRMLLDAGADPAQRDHIGNNALHAVTVGGNTEVARELCRDYPDLLNEVNYSGNTPLHDSVGWKKPGVTAILVEAGADPCICNEKAHMWPIRVALESRQLDQVKLIFPLHRGRFSRHDTDNCTILHILACANLTRELEEAVRAAPQIINKVNNYGNSSLHDAVQRNSEDAVRILLEHGADHTQIGRNGREILCWAASNGNVNNLKQLLKAGAKPTNEAVWKGDHGEVQPLVCVAARQAPELIRILLKVPGVDYCACTTSGRNALHSAMSARRWDTASVVLQHDLAHGKKLIEERNKWGATPLHNAAEFGSLKLVQELIDAGSVLSTAKKDGDTELDVAVKHGHAEIAKFLRQHGAKSKEDFRPSKPVLTG